MSAHPTVFHQPIEGEPKDAASVVLLRELPGAGLQVFMLRRGGSSTVMNDAYVFPGGKVDPEDAAPDQLAALNLSAPAEVLIGEPELGSQRAGAMFVAACRETLEETGVQVRAADLIPLSRWITPKVPAMMRKRFDTRFFIATLPDDAQEAVHDGQEADASAWYSPREALERYRDREIALAPPQIMTLAGLVGVRSVLALREQMRGHRPRLVEPLSVQVGEHRVMCLPGDPRHPVAEQVIAGPTSLTYRNERFEPDGGFEQFFSVQGA